MEQISRNWNTLLRDIWQETQMETLEKIRHLNTVVRTKN